MRAFAFAELGVFARHLTFQVDVSRKDAKFRKARKEDSARVTCVTHRLPDAHRSRGRSSLLRLEL